MDRDTKLIAILRQQCHIMLMASWEKIYSVLGYGIYFLPTSSQYNVVLPLKMAISLYSY